MDRRPNYDPDELAEYDMTEDEAEAVRQGMLEIDRGETVDGPTAMAEIRKELEALLTIQERRRENR